MCSVAGVVVAVDVREVVVVVVGDEESDEGGSARVAGTVAVANPA